MSSQNGKHRPRIRGGHAPWKPGESGNPAGGRKNAVSVADTVRRIMAEATKRGGLEEARHEAEWLVRHLIELAHGNDMVAIAAARLLFDKADPHETIVTINESVTYAHELLDRLRIAMPTN